MPGRFCLICGERFMAEGLAIRQNTCGKAYCVAERTRRRKRSWKERRGPEFAAWQKTMPAKDRWVWLTEEGPAHRFLEPGDTVIGVIFVISERREHFVTCPWPRSFHWVVKTWEPATRTVCAGERCVPSIDNFEFHVHRVNVPVYGYVYPTYDVEGRALFDEAVVYPHTVLDRCTICHVLMADAKLKYVHPQSNETLLEYSMVQAWHQLPRANYSTVEVHKACPVCKQAWEGLAHQFRLCEDAIELVKKECNDVEEQEGTGNAGWRARKRAENDRGVIGEAAGAFQGPSREEGDSCRGEGAGACRGGRARGKAGRDFRSARGRDNIRRNLVRKINESNRTQG